MCLEGSLGICESGLREEVEREAKSGHLKPWAWTESPRGRGQRPRTQPWEVERREMSRNQPQSTREAAGTPGQSMVPEDAVVTMSNAWELTSGLVTRTALVASMMSSFSRVMGQRPDRTAFKVSEQEPAARGCGVRVWASEPNPPSDQF